MIEFLRQNYRWIAGGFLLTYCSSFGQTFFISASVGEWQARFDLSYGQFGLLYLIATLGSALTLPFLGRIVDVMPEHRVIALIMPVLAFACLLAAFAPTLPLLALGLYLLRLCGQGMMTHIAFTTIGKWFASQRGRAVSLVTLGHQGGEATLPLLGAAVALNFGWQSVWMSGAAALVIIALPLAIWAFRVPRHPRGHAPGVAGSARDWTRAQVIRDPVFYALLTGVLAPPFIGTVIFFHQDYMTALRGWPLEAMALSFTVMACTTIVVALIIGSAIDRFGAIRILPFYLLPLSGACIMAAFNPAVWGLFAFMFLLGISYGVSSTLFGALWPEVYGTTHLGAVRSTTVSYMVLATAIGPGVTGALIDRGIALPEQLIVLGGYCLLACVIMGFASRVLHARRAAHLQATTTTE